VGVYLKGNNSPKYCDVFFSMVKRNLLGSLWNSISESAEETILTVFLLRSHFELELDHVRAVS